MPVGEQGGQEGPSAGPNFPRCAKPRLLKAKASSSSACAGEAQ